MFKKPIWQTVWTQIRLLIGAVCSGSTLFASILNFSVMLGNYLQQTTPVDNIFRCIFFLGALRVEVNLWSPQELYLEIDWSSQKQLTSLNLGRIRKVFRIENEPTAMKLIIRNLETKLPFKSSNLTMTLLLSS